MKRLFPYLFSAILVYAAMFGHSGLHDAENYNQRNIDVIQTNWSMDIYDVLEKEKQDKILKNWYLWKALGGTAEEYEQILNGTYVETPRLEDAIVDAKASTVHIQCPDWQGSGAVISENLIVTARHVVQGADHFTITFDNGMKVESDLAIFMDNYDVAFIWIEESYVEPLKLGSIDECVVGQQIFIIGSPFGDINFNMVSTGIISGLNRDWDDVDPYTGESYGWSIVFNSDSSASPGNSGGPLFTMDGKIRGILVGGYNSTVNCLMPSDLFNKDIEAIEDMFYLGIPLDGYSVNEVPEDVEWEY